MEEKIKVLKNLAIAYRCALEYDYCPDPTEARDIIADLFIIDYDKLTGVLDEYVGWSTGDIESKVFGIIESL